MKHEHAKAIADKLLAILEPHCLMGKALIGGSIRREKLDVKDIEIIACPKEDKVATLFGDGDEHTRSAAFIAALKSLGSVTKGTDFINGRMYKITIDVRQYLGVVNEPIAATIALDLFVPTVTDFWRIAVIRTGSSEWVQAHVAGRWVKMGWVRTSDGLRRREECRLTKSDTWECIAVSPTIPPAWSDEAEFLNWLGYTITVPPKYRV